jgi:hypothetical protein
MLLPLLLNNLLGDAPVLVTVPDVVGQSQASGTAELEADLFVVAVATANSSTVAAGNIISQNPLAGASASQGSTVTITVSLGDASVSGGFYEDFHPILTRGRKRLRERLEEIEEEAEQIPDKVEREIATLIKVQDAKSDEVAELARLQALADRYAAPGVDVPRPVLASVMKAHEERTRNALEQMRREIEQMMDEEEQAIIALLMMDD